MNEIVVQTLLRRLESDWRSLQPRSDEDTITVPPWGVWIRLLAPLPAESVDVFFPDAQLRNQLMLVWFLDAQGLREENVWAYHRFVAMHNTDLWRYLVYEPSLLFRSAYHKIATATIAPYQGSTDWYLDYLWGGLYGGGFRLAIDEKGRVRDTTGLWIS